jgi:hypothetical protein
MGFGAVRIDIVGIYKPRPPTAIFRQMITDTLNNLKPMGQKSLPSDAMSLTTAKSSPVPVFRVLPAATTSLKHPL